jgi:hypothetical protein
MVAERLAPRGRIRLIVDLERLDGDSHGHRQGLGAGEDVGMEAEALARPGRAGAPEAVNGLIGAGQAAVAAQHR